MLGIYGCLSALTPPLPTKIRAADADENEAARRRRRPSSRRCTAIFRVGSNFCPLPVLSMKQSEGSGDVTSSQSGSGAKQACLYC